MARVLFIAYHFPPIGYSGTQRTVKFVRYLPEHGFEPVVLTGPVASEPGGIPRDATLLDELPRDLRVVRVQGPEPEAHTGWRGRAERWFGFEHPWARWWVESVATAGAADARGGDLIFATMSPFESSQAAARLSHETGRPWVADLRDPWALDEMFAYLTVVHRRRARTEMRRSLGSAAAIVMNTPEAAAQLVRGFPELSDRPVVAIPNGYDAADFAAPVAPREDQAFRIAHTGSFHTEAGRARLRMSIRRLLGGTINGIDVLPRSHVYLLQAVRVVLERRPDLAGRLEVHLAGTLSASDRDIIDPDVVRIHGYLAHAESVALIRSADLLFLPMYGLRAGARARIVPGKTYEYLATGHPILGAVPEGDARDLLASAGTGILCRPDDTEAMAGAIIDLIDRRDTGEPSPQPDHAVIERYERRRLTAELAAVFERVLSGR